MQIKQYSTSKKVAMLRRADELLANGLSTSNSPVDFTRFWLIFVLEFFRFPSGFYAFVIPKRSVILKSIWEIWD